MNTQPHVKVQVVLPPCNEQNLSKTRYSALYMVAPMGNNYVGVQAAAQNYFSKDASELTLPECALLAGL